MPTDERFWNCACAKRYTHAKIGSAECVKCGTNGFDRPDSRTSDIADGLSFANPRAWEFASLLPEYQGVEYLS